MSHNLFNRLLRLLNIVSLPQGLRFKVTEKAFNFELFRLCRELRCYGLVPRTIVDIGANIGQFALAASAIFPEAKVYSYEPLSESFQWLNDLANRIPNIHATRKAIGAAVGEQQMRVANATASSSFLDLHANHMSAYPDIRQTHDVAVEVTTLECEMEAFSCLSPALLKLDVQGYEGAVLRGAGDKLKLFDWILLETSTCPQYHGETLFFDLCERLLEKGFHFRTPVDIHAASGHLPTQFDALFVRNDLQNL